MCRIGCTQRPRLGDGGALSCVTLGRLPLNKDIKLSLNSCCSVAFCRAGTEVQQSSKVEIRVLSPPTIAKPPVG